MNTININLFLLLLASFFLIILFYEISKIISVIFLIIRDFVFLISSSLILIFFLTPIIWEPSMLNEQNLFYLQFNPFYHLVEVFRSIVFGSFSWNTNFKVTITIYLVLKLINILITNKIIYKVNLYS